MDVVPRATSLSYPDVPPLRPLTADGVARVQAAALRVLEEAGVAVGSAPIRARLVAAGGGSGVSVDEATGRVRFTPAFVSAALAAAPRGYTLCARDAAWDLPLDGRHGYLSVDGSAAEMLDPESGVRRSTTLADLVTVTRLGDALPEISFLWQGAEAGDVPVAIRSARELQAQCTWSGKHIQVMTAVDPSAARACVELAQVVAGGAAALRSRPIISSFQCPVSPLTFDADAIEAGIVFAEAGVPAGFVSMALAAGTAPATLAGTVVQTVAEVVAGLVITQALVPGAPVFFGACPTAMDLRSGLVRGGPEDSIFQAALAQVARDLRLPSSIGTFSPSAFASDWQAGLEGGVSGLASALSGADMMSGAGLLHGARVFSLDEMVLDAEAFGFVARVAAGIPDVSDEALAVEVINRVGPGGTYLAEKHTRAHMRELWLPKVFGSGSWEAWEGAGRPDARVRARERREALLAAHVPAPLADGVAEEMERVVAACKAEAGLA